MKIYRYIYILSATDFLRGMLEYAKTIVRMWKNNFVTLKYSSASDKDIYGSSSFPRRAISYSDDYLKGLTEYEKIFLF